MFKAVRLNAITYPVEETEREELARAGAELIEIEGQEPHEILAAADMDRLPEIEHVMRCDTIHIDETRVTLGAIANQARAIEA